MVGKVLRPKEGMTSKSDLPTILQALVDAQESMSELDSIVRIHAEIDPDTWRDIILEIMEIKDRLGVLEGKLDGNDQIPF